MLLLEARGGASWVRVSRAEVVAVALLKSRVLEAAAAARLCARALCRVARAGEAAEAAEKLVASAVVESMVTAARAESRGMLAPAAALVAFASAEVM